MTDEELAIQLRNMYSPVGPKSPAAGVILTDPNEGPPNSPFRTAPMTNAYLKAFTEDKLTPGGGLLYEGNARYNPNATISNTPVNIPMRNPQALQQGALLGPTTEKLPPGYDAGVKQGDANRSKEEQLGFMDKIFSNPMLQRLMERSLYSQPTFGGNFISEQASGERGLRSMEAQSAELAQKKAMENNKIQATLREAELKAGVQPKLTGEASTLYKTIYGAEQRITTANSIKKLLAGPIATGGASAAKDGIVNLAAAFGFNLGVTQGQSVDKLFNVLKRQMIASKVFGRETNKQEQEIVDKLLPSVGVFTNIGQLLESLNVEIASASKEARNASATLKNFNYNVPSSFPTQKYKVLPDRGK